MLCRYAECRYAECRYVECHGAITIPRITTLGIRTRNLTKNMRHSAYKTLSIMTISITNSIQCDYADYGSSFIVILSVIMPSVIMLSVVASY
jgi:hypothetical protein